MNRIISESIERQETFERLLKIMVSERFLSKKGLTNDLPYFILPYDPRLEVEAMQARDLLVRRLIAKSIDVLDLNIYDVCKSILDTRGLWDRLVEKESEIEKSQLLETLNSVLDPKKYLVPAIVEQLEESKPAVLLLSGIGEVFPYVRSHALLTNLQSAASNQLTVMFFPGEYTFTPESGATLDVFGLKQDDRFYRAINILQYEV